MGLLMGLAKEMARFRHGAHVGRLLRAVSITVVSWLLLAVKLIVLLLLLMLHLVVIKARYPRTTHCWRVVAISIARLLLMLQTLLMLQMLLLLLVVVMLLAVVVMVVMTVTMMGCMMMQMTLMRMVRMIEVMLLLLLVHLLRLGFDLPIDVFQGIAYENRTVERLLGHLTEAGQLEH